MKWDNLTGDQYTRLCECRSLRVDIMPIAQAYMNEKGYDAKTALIATLEHLDANGQFFDVNGVEWGNMIIDLTYSQKGVTV